MPDLGTKHECYECGARFYDLGRPTAICPKCGADQKDAKRPEPPETSPARRRRPKAEPEREEVESKDEDLGDDGEDYGDDEELVTPDGGDDDGDDDLDDEDDDD